MPEQQKQSRLWLAVVISAIILAMAIIWTVVKKQPQIVYQHPHNHEHSFEPLTKSTDDANRPRISLNDVIRDARLWGPTYESWFGKMAPDFTLTDITGKQHKLSDYRGKNVMLTFWATWCGPCLIEVPHLIALRNIISEDKLAMLAISSEPPALVKRFLAGQKINYTVFASDIRAMPAPFNSVNAIPCSFFIGPDGRIKLATEGTLSLGEIKAILQAE